MYIITAQVGSTLKLDVLVYLLSKTGCVSLQILLKIAHYI